MYDAEDYSALLKENISDREDMVSALLATHNLFSRLASQTAEMKGYQYPKEAENYTKILLEKAK